MSDTCRTDGKNSRSGVNLNSISAILKTLLNVFNLYRTAAPALPPQLVFVGGKLKPGMSANNLSAKIISKLESKVGIPMNDDVFGGEENKFAKAINTVCEETVNEIITNAAVDVAGVTNVTVATAVGPGQGVGFGKMQGGIR